MVEVIIQDPVLDRQRDKEIEIERDGEMELECSKREVYRKCSPKARQAVEDRTHPSPPRVSAGCRLWGFWFRVLGIGFAV